MKEIVVIPASIDNKIFGNQNKILRVASYSRVSTNFEEQLSSFHLQKSYYTDLILQTKGWTLAGTYADEGISGTTEDKRPGFQKLMNHCRKGKIDLIITKSLSRFSRNLVVTLNRVRELKSMGIGVYFEKENINTLEENSELLLTILASLAQEESYSISMNIKKGKQMAIKEGRVTWNYKNNYGYRKGEDGNPEIIPEHAEIIKKIYKYYLKGESDRGVASKLNDEGLKPIKTDKWDSSSIQRILKNERYCGDVILQKTYIENHITKKVKINNGELPKVHIKNNHPAIIEREVYEEAIKERARRNSKTKVSPKGEIVLSKYSSKKALSELLVCDCCLSKYRRLVWTKKTRQEVIKQPVWRCTQRLEYGKEYCKGSVTLNEEQLQNAVIKAINRRNGNDVTINDLIIKEVEKTYYQNKTDKVNIAELEKRIKKITDEVMEIVSSGNVSEKIFIMKSMNEEAMQLQKIVDEYYSTEDNVKISDKINRVEKFLFEKREHSDYDNSLVKQMISIIRVINKNKILITFKDGQEVEQYF